MISREWGRCPAANRALLKIMKSSAVFLLLLPVLLPALPLEAAATGSQAEGCVATGTQDSGHVLPADWMEWAKRIEKIHPVTDAAGHGPDIGSPEWSGAMDKKLRITDVAGHGPDLGSMEWRRAVEKKLRLDTASVPEKTRELLSAHSTVSRFEGVKDHQCLGLTALCPDRCGESGKLATFTIIKYLNYENAGNMETRNRNNFWFLSRTT